MAKWTINGIPAEQFFLQNPNLGKEKRDLIPYTDNSTKILSEYNGVANLTHQQLKNIYQKIYPLCTSYKLGLTYNQRENTLNTNKCGLWYCDRCRQRKKSTLKKSIEQAIQEHNLTNHIIITTEGNEKYRNDNDYKQSYKDMMYAWNIIRKTIKRKATKRNHDFSYILLNRAQKNGYSHLHILTNYPIKKSTLRKIVAHYPNIGFVEITQHTNTAKYLTNDFNKDHEFYIPFNTRHYTTSRNINLQDETEENPHDVIHIQLTKQYNFLNRIINPYFQQAQEQIESFNNYPVPFHFLIEEYYVNLRRKENENRFPMDRKNEFIRPRENKRRLLETENSSSIRRPNTHPDILHKIRPNLLRKNDCSYAEKNNLENQVTTSQSVVDWM